MLEMSLCWADVNPPSWDVLHSISQSQKSFLQHPKCHIVRLFFFFFMQRGEQTVHLTVHMKVQKQSAPQWQISNQTDSSSTFFFSFSFYSVCPCNSLDLSYRNILIIFFSPNILAFQKSTSFDWKVVSPLDIFNSFFYQLNYILTLVCGA